MMVWMTRCQAPESVYTIGHIHDPKLISAKQPDTAIVTLKFKNGIMCTIDLSRDSVYGYDIRLEVILFDMFTKLSEATLKLVIIRDGKQYKKTKKSIEQAGFHFVLDLFWI